MSYVEDITESLIRTLTYAGGLPTQKLAGHAANLEFWVGEVEHALGVIDGYRARFIKLRDGERDAVERTGYQWHPFRSEKPIRPGIGDHDLKELRRRLTDAAIQILSRCYKEGLVSENELEAYGDRLNLDQRELRGKGSH